jgi:hypothetical protein
VQVPTRGAVALRTVSRCRFEGTPTRCVVDITRLRLSGDRRHVVAVGTVTPRSLGGRSGRASPCSSRSRAATS